MHALVSAALSSSSCCAAACLFSLSCFSILLSGKDKQIGCTYTPIGGSKPRDTGSLNKSSFFCLVSFDAALPAAVVAAAAPRAAGAAAVFAAAAVAAVAAALRLSSFCLVLSFRLSFFCVSSSIHRKRDALFASTLSYPKQTKEK